MKYATKRRYRALKQIAVLARQTNVNDTDDLEQKSRFEMTVLLEKHHKKVCKILMQLENETIK